MTTTPALNTVSFPQELGLQNRHLSTPLPGVPYEEQPEVPGKVRLLKSKSWEMKRKCLMIIEMERILQTPSAWPKTSWL